jgi:hypothetical protein
VSLTVSGATGSHWLPMVITVVCPILEINRERFQLVCFVNVTPPTAWL